MNIKANCIESPIFLVGAERSGTTLLRLMLDHHTQIAFNSEFDYVIEQVSDSGDWPELEQYYEFLDFMRYFPEASYEIDRSLSYPELVNSFLVQKKNQAGKPIVGATVHHHFDRLLWIWPKARFIHIIRDPRDVARSCIGMGWSGNVWTGVDRWLEAEKIWENLQQRIPEDRKIEIKYEILIKDFAATLTRICEFIGVPYDEAMLDYAKKTTYKSPNSSLVQQWKTKLSKQQIRLVESKIGKRLTERGYELSGLPPLTVTPLMERQLKLQDWWYRFQWRIKRFGLPLFLSDFLSRRLRIEGWQKQVKYKMNAIAINYLQ
ncbi:sulfotransferase family protein [Gloeothece verrucosa]|uniref:Sulfotransferase n=1 Tax=Gloeothece verrucosa (strain PCC 7822) TaxID=497965 RepID=E0U5T0_GLOV7|nr:sulfotransferase [Gloeothece verrucosa]ADN15921.1 sulfotransferase [Gloeothece verrucosa PCC 7822]